MKKLAFAIGCSCFSVAVTSTIYEVSHINFWLFIIGIALMLIDVKFSKED